MKFNSIILFMMFTTIQGQVIFSDTLGIGDNENSVESKTFTFNIGYYSIEIKYHRRTGTISIRSYS